jgi:hypothetical protein
MKNLKIKIKAFEVYADPEDREAIVSAILLQIEEMAEENFFTAIVSDDDEDMGYEDDSL